MAGSLCNQVATTNVGATLSSIPAVSSLCSTPGGKDVWFKFLAPASGNFSIQTFAGTLTDAVMTMYYANTCQQLSPHQCVDDVAGNLMPNIIGTGYIAGSEIYIRVWGKNNSSGNFSICVKDGSTLRLTPEFNNFEIYPNPATELLTVKLNTPGITSTINISCGPSPNIVLPHCY